jgi:hypothetical protein
VHLWRRYLAWREHNGEREAAQFARHPWRKGIVYAPVCAGGCFLAGWLAGGSISSAAIVGVLVGGGSIFVYRFVFGPSIIRGEAKRRSSA